MRSRNLGGSTSIGADRLWRTPLPDGVVRFTVILPTAEAGGFWSHATSPTMPASLETMDSQLCATGSDPRVGAAGVGCPAIFCAPVNGSAGVIPAPPGYGAPQLL